jgi:hypothetical protein
MTADAQALRGLDLGDGHRLFFHSWKPDRRLNPQYDEVPDCERFGATVEHRNRQTGVRCVGSLTFTGAVQDRIRPDAPKWVVDSWEPLSMLPSVMCSCGDHGWIRAGRWIAL